MHDVAQRCYDDLAAAMAAWKADADARLEQLVTEMRTVVAAAEARMLDRVRGWKGDPPDTTPAQAGRPGGGQDGEPQGSVPDDGPQPQGTPYAPGVTPMFPLRRAAP